MGAAPRRCCFSIPRWCPKRVPKPPVRACPSTAFPGVLWCHRPRPVPPEGAGRRQAMPSPPVLSLQPLGCSALTSFPKNGKKIALPGGCPPLPVDALPNLAGSRRKPRRSPKRKKKNPNHGDFWKSTTRFGRSPALVASTEAPGCRIVLGLAPPPRAVQTEPGPPHKFWGTPKPPRVFFFPALLQAKGNPGLGSTHRGRESSFPLGPSPDAPLV